MTFYHIQFLLIFYQILFYVFSQKYSPRTIHNFKIQNDLSEYLAQLGSNSKLAIATSRELAKNINSGLTSSFYCFERSESIHEYAVKFLVRKNIPYLNKLNNFIGMASAGGLIEKWHENIHINKHKPKENYQIQLKHLAGIFMLWSILLFCIFGIFLIEVVVYKQVRKPNASRFWIICEIFLDSRRHFLLKDRMA